MERHPATFVATVCLGLTIFAAPDRTSAQEATAFFDDFDQFDEERWYVSDGWTNGDWQACTWSRESVDVKAGTLTLALAPPQAGVEGELCGEIQTKSEFLYGTFEARIRTATASGVNAAFFTYIGPAQDEPWNEIDVEILTRNPAQVEFATHKEDAPSRQKTVPIPGGPANEGFHTYSFTWEPERVRWYVDGVLLHEESGTDLPSIPQKIYLSHWNTRTLTDWMGEFEAIEKPLPMEVDWVGYTPLGEGCQFEESVLCAESTESQ